MSGDGLPFDAAKAKFAMQELMKTPEGRKIADKIKARLKDLDVAFQGLGEGDKQEFMKKFKGKFTETFDDLRESIKKNVIDNEVPSIEEEQDFLSDNALPNDNTNPLRYTPQPNYWLFIVAFLIILFIIGWKYFCSEFFLKF